MSTSDAEKWNARYREGSHLRAEPVRVLKEYSHLLPASGTALDLACGTGANALFLAQHGLETWAWDISREAIEQLQRSAARLDFKLHTEVRDVVRQPPDADAFDVVVVSHFLDRDLMPPVLRALRQNGLLYYQTFTKERVDDSGPGNEAYRLGKNELLELCRGLHIVMYREEGRLGDIRRGFRNEAMLIAQRLILPAKRW